MKFKIPKKITIGATTFIVKQNKKGYGASFSFSEATMTIGTKSLAKSPGEVFDCLVHEISEAIHVMMSARYYTGHSDTEYKFIMDHQEFTSHNTLLSGIIYNQILN